MVEAGIDDVLVPVNVLGAAKLARLAALLERADVTVSVDDARLLPGLAEAARARRLGVLVDCDTGLGRTGVATPEAAAELAGAVARTEGLRFDGFITYPAPERGGCVSRRSGCSGERRRPRHRSRLRRWHAGHVALGELASTVTEYRVGTYAFHDRATVAAGAATLDDVAMTVRATVISCPARDRVILDAGSKALTSDLGPDAAYGAILEAPGAFVSKLNEEHAYVGLGAEGLELGQEVHVVPNHACVVSNLFDRFTVVRRGSTVDEWPISRGR